MQHIALSKKRYSFPELYQTIRTNIYIKNLNYREYDPIVTVKKYSINHCHIPDKKCKILYDLGEDSKVGKGCKTVLDKTVRSSKEFTDIELNEEFLSSLTKQVDIMLYEMGAGELEKISPYKLIIYGPGDFFSEHIDSCHTIGQNMTCIVDLPSEYEGKGFQIDDTETKKMTECANIIVFDHDIPHKVHPVTSGYRLSLTFDLVVKQTENSGITGNEMIEILKALGVRRFGFFAMHRYMDSQQALKGLDSVWADIFRPYVKNISRVNLVRGFSDYHDTNSDWYLEEIYNVLNKGPECGMLMENILENLAEGYDLEEFQPEEPQKYTRPDSDYFYRSNETWHNFFKDEYKLGDILVLNSKAKPVITKVCDEDVFLGNEGFHGKVIENAFIILEIHTEIR